MIFHKAASTETKDWFKQSEKDESIPDKDWDFEDKLNEYRLA